MEIAGIVLAGGKSTRFGTDKAISLFQGKSMLDRKSTRLKSSHEIQSRRPSSA